MSNFELLNNSEGISFEELFYTMKKTPAFAEYIHWQELQDRILVINVGIDESSVEEYLMPIIKWNREDKFKMEKERKPITIYLNTPGGDTFHGLILAEAIKKSKTPVHVVALSIAASMGSVLLSAGHVRKAYKYSNILIHDGETGVHGTSKKAQDHMNYLKKKNDQIKDFLIANSKITVEKYDSMEDREWWFTAEEALEYGLIDEIIEEIA